MKFSEKGLIRKKGFLLTLGKQQTAGRRRGGPTPSVSKRRKFLRFYGLIAYPG